MYYYVIRSLKLKLLSQSLSSPLSLWSKCYASLSPIVYLILNHIWVKWTREFTSFYLMECTNEQLLSNHKFTNCLVDNILRSSHFDYEDKFTFLSPNQCPISKRNLLDTHVKWNTFNYKVTKKKKEQLYDMQKNEKAAVDRKHHAETSQNATSMWFLNFVIIMCLFF